MTSRTAPPASQLETATEPYGKKARLEAFLLVSYCCIAILVVLGYLHTHSLHTDLEGFNYHLTLWPGVLIVTLQAAVTAPHLWVIATRAPAPLDDKALESAHSICIALGILGTFIGFSIIFHEFAFRGAGEAVGTPPHFSPQTYASIKLAFSTSISGIILASFFDFIVSLARGRRHREQQLIYRKTLQGKELGECLDEIGGCIQQLEQMTAKPGKPSFLQRITGRNGNGRDEQTEQDRQAVGAKLRVLIPRAIELSRNDRDHDKPRSA